MSDDIVPGLGIPKPTKTITTLFPPIPIPSTRQKRKHSRPPPFSEHVFDGFGEAPQASRAASPTGRGHQSPGLDEQRHVLQNLVTANAQKRLGNIPGANDPKIDGQVTQQDINEFFSALDESVVMDWERSNSATPSTPCAQVSAPVPKLAAVVQNITSGGRSSIASTPRPSSTGTPRSIPTEPKAMRSSQELSPQKRPLAPRFEKHARSITNDSTRSTPSANRFTSTQKDAQRLIEQLLPTLGRGDTTPIPAAHSQEQTPPASRRPSGALANAPVMREQRSSTIGSPSLPSSDSDTPSRKKRRRSPSPQSHRFPSSRLHRSPSPRARSPVRQRVSDRHYRDLSSSPSDTRGRHRSIRHLSSSPPPPPLSSQYSPKRHQSTSRGRSTVRGTHRPSRASSMSSTWTNRSAPAQTFHPQLPVPGNWFVRMGAELPRIIDASFIIDSDTWGAYKIGTKSSLKLCLCCVPTMAITEAQKALLSADNISPESLALAVSKIETEWPPAGNIIIQINRTQPYGRTWMPLDLIAGSPVDFTGHVQLGTNDLRFIQLANLADYTFVLTAFFKSEEQVSSEGDRLDQHLERSFRPDPIDHSHAFMNMPCRVVR